jgi:hypothetical protein
MTTLNWDTFLNINNNESLDVPYDQWSDLTTVPTGFLTSEMPKSTSADTSGSTPEDVPNFQSMLNAPPVDPYFDDSFFTSNDYFLGDLEVFKPFGNIAGGGASTSESSPEPVSAISPSGQDFTTFLAEMDQLPQMTMAQGRAMERADALTNPASDSLLLSNPDAGFVEDFTSPDDAQSKGQLNIATTRRRSSDTTKRNKGKTDIISACWTSPLCPNHDDVDGQPPNPSTCGGGCAPFLFANNDTLPIITDLLAEPQEVTAADGIVEIQPRPKKRSESDTSDGGPSGRHFDTTTTTTNWPVDNTPRMKSETSDDLPDKDSPQHTTEEKPKSRRRLPHNQVERKYRESLNTQLESLRRVVPSLQENQEMCDGADIEDLPVPSKPSKAVILASATAYIKQQEKDRKTMADENQALKAKVKALQALVKCDDCGLMQYVMDMKINQGKQ